MAPYGAQWPSPAARGADQRGRKAGTSCPPWVSSCAVKAFEAAYGVKFPEATAKITDDLAELLALYDYPAGHWVHLRMAFKLIESAQDRWRVINAPNLVALVCAGAILINGKLIERPSEDTQPEAA